MFDIYNRKIDYIRISVTDRCNLRCIYCMPEKGIKNVSHKDILSYEEIVYSCENFAKIGTSKIKIKITGGEPLVRNNLVHLIKKIKSIQGIKNVTLTTNGILLEEQIDLLVKAGLDAVNVSIDALDESTYKNITRIGDVNKVIRGINKTLEYKEINVKVNCVPIEGINNKQVLDIIKMIIEENFGKLTTFNKSIGNGPSNYYSLDNFQGKIGFISAVSHKFCENCNRVRLTSNGFLKTCLQYSEGQNLRTLIKNGRSDEEIIEVIKRVIYNKPRENKFLEVNHYENFEQNIMSQIGG